MKFQTVAEKNTRKKQKKSRDTLFMSHPVYFSNPAHHRLLTPHWTNFKDSESFFGLLFCFRLFILFFFKFSGRMLD